MRLNIFGLFKRKKREKEEDILSKDSRMLQEIQYPIMRDLQIQSDVSYVLQVINSKIDTLLAKVDNLSLRLNNIEQILYNFLYRR